jgi:roadblock/LC7 domain-containing protein
MVVGGIMTRAKLVAIKKDLVRDIQVAQARMVKATNVTAKAKAKAQLEMSLEVQAALETGGLAAKPEDATIVKAKRNKKSPDVV